MARILVGYDGSPPSQRALEWALDRATKDDEIVILTTISSSVAQSSLGKMMPAGVTIPGPLESTFEQNAGARLEELKAQNAKRGVPIQTAVRQGEPSEAFLAAVSEFNIDHIVIGHKSRERSELKLGPIAESLVKNLPATVTVVR